MLNEKSLFTKKSSEKNNQIVRHLFVSEHYKLEVFTDLELKTVFLMNIKKISMDNKVLDVNIEVEEGIIEDISVNTNVFIGWTDVDKLDDILNAIDLTKKYIQNIYELELLVNANAIVKNGGR